MADNPSTCTEPGCRKCYLASARQVLLVERQPELETLSLSAHVSPETPSGKKWLLRERPTGSKPK